MSLGNPKLNQFVRSHTFEFTTALTWTKILDEDPNRVGLFLPNPESQLVGAWIANPTSAAFRGFATFATAPYANLFTYAEHGDLVQQEWWFRSFTNTFVYPIIIQDVPEWVMEQMRIFGGVSGPKFVPGPE